VHRWHVIDIAGQRETGDTFASEKLARHKIPRYVRTIDEFPMTITGKVRKVELREMAVELLRGD
jgi:fatty-acyl-CoA synthase